ncbi:hypothetical protein [Phenylobacterium sp.]|uniref:hypothetical protein n=1 Tax=Phenylobacterium sp. TaxID=1871053 RepID=UPI00391DB6F1
MSTISSAAAAASQFYAVPAAQKREPDTAAQAAEKTSAKVAELTGTAVAAQSVKEANKGTALDVYV